jgi:predicted nucleotidyltransferase component of viral defense system
MDARSLGLSDAEVRHAQVMLAIARSLKDTPLVLKGGTSLLLCYGLDRFSEDLDFDSPHKISVKSKIEVLFKEIHASIEKWGVPKDTDTVYRAKLDYTYEKMTRGLKLEVSFRNPPGPDDIHEVNGVRVLKLPRIIHQKLCAAHDGDHTRSVVRDLYDLNFLASKHGEHFDAGTAARLRAFAADPVALAERYKPDHQEDALVNGRIQVDDLAIAVHENSLVLARKFGLS